MRRKLRCTLACEDIGHEQLFRPILKRHFTRVAVVPRRAGGGFTFVLSRLAVEARVLRQHPNEAMAVLVVIDADASGFERRQREIYEILDREGLVGGSRDRMGICIPVRNIETWKLWLGGSRDLDEHGDFKDRYQRESKRGLAPKQLVEAWFSSLSEAQRQEEERKLPALARGREEIRRLQTFAQR